MLHDLHFELLPLADSARLKDWLRHSPLRGRAFTNERKSLVDYWQALAQKSAETDVLGDIEQWATMYLDSGSALADWEQRMQTQEAHFATYCQRAAGPETPAMLPEIVDDND